MRRVKNVSRTLLAATLGKVPFHPWTTTSHIPLPQNHKVQTSVEERLLDEGRTVERKEQVALAGQELNIL